MPRQNRVTPQGELIATPERGLVYANRGCLHDHAGRIRRHHNGRRWIACRLRFKGWHRGQLMQPGKFTELFFLDEATAFAAGHRPCALCRREDYNRFGELWSELHPGVRGADEIDLQLHDERWDTGARVQRLHRADARRLPNGTFVLGDDGRPLLVVDDHLLAWSPAGYSTPQPRPRAGAVKVITPPSLVAILEAGWQGAVPVVHPSATQSVEP